MNEDTKYQTVDAFDRLLGELHGLPDVTASRESTITVPGLVETSTFIVQTYRQRDIGDRIFIQRVDRHGAVRIAIPPRVADAIARQRESLVTKSRSNAARAAAEQRDAPAHLLTPEVRKRAVAARVRNAKKRAAKRAKRATK